jgi:hypothetical protein
MAQVPQVPVERYRSTLNDRFGRLSAGQHKPGSGEASAMEAASAARGIQWTDDPSKVGLPDILPLNDGPWGSDDKRTQALVPVVEKLWDWEYWPEERRVAWARSVAMRTVREVVADCIRAFGATEAAERCASAGTLEEARVAAWVAVSELAKRSHVVGPVMESARSARRAVRGMDAMDTACEAALAAYHAARAWEDHLGRSDAAEAALRTACRIWREEADR